jgi:hypothetical protein
MGRLFQPTGYCICIFLSCQRQRHPAS